MKTKLRVLFLGFIIVLTSAGPALAVAHGQCVDLFPGGVSTASPSYTPFQSARLQEVSFTPGFFGGKILTIEQKSIVKKNIFFQQKIKLLPWEDYGTHADQPGDLRVASLFLPTQLKNYLSIRALDADKTEIKEAHQIKSEKLKALTIPDYQEATQAIQILQSEVRKQDVGFRMFQFYAATEIVTGLKYIQNLAEQAQFPLTTNGHLFEHDFNYHFLSSLVTPSRLVAAVQRRAQIIVKFHDFVSKKSGKYPALKDLESQFEKKVLASATSRFDLMANVFVWVVANKGESSRQENLMGLQADLKNIFLTARSPLKYLERLLQQSKLGLSYGDEKFIEESTALFSEFEKQLSIEFVSEDLSDKWQNAEFVYGETWAQLQLIEQTAARLNRQRR